MKKLFANIGGVALACLAAQKLGGSVNWAALGGGVAMCVVANLVGLSQQPPQFGSKE